MHWIQRHILEQLMVHDILRFSELRASDVESNLFQYHLRHLIRKGLVEKCERGYRLAPKGLYYADRFSPEYNGERPQPKLITIVILKNAEGKVLVQQKPRQPWLGEYHLPAGKIHAGETTNHAATRELEEKTGLHIDDMWFRCLTHVQIVKEGTLVSDYFGFIFLGRYTGEIENGYWYDPDDETDTLELAPSVQQVLGFERIGDNGFHPLVLEL
jgi:8-oxo-dGTP pyrophosphatase MutT (NUDIX family)